MTWHSQDDRVTYVIEQLHPFDDGAQRIVKIGSTTASRVGRRVDELQTGSAWPLVVRAVIRASESGTRRRFHKHRLYGEWLRLGPRHLQSLMNVHGLHPCSDQWVHDTTVLWHGRTDCTCTDCRGLRAQAEFRDRLMSMLEAVAS